MAPGSEELPPMRSVSHRVRYTLSSSSLSVSRLPIGLSDPPAQAFRFGSRWFSSSEKPPSQPTPHFMVRMVSKPLEYSMDTLTKEGYGEAAARLNALQRGKSREEIIDS